MDEWILTCYGIVAWSCKHLTSYYSTVTLRSLLVFHDFSNYTITVWAKDKSPGGIVSWWKLLKDFRVLSSQVLSVKCGHFEQTKQFLEVAGWHFIHGISFQAYPRALTLDTQQDSILCECGIARCNYSHLVVHHRETEKGSALCKYPLTCQSNIQDTTNQSCFDFLVKCFATSWLQLFVRFDKGFYTRFGFVKMLSNSTLSVQQH